MTFLELKNQFNAILNRTDITSALTTTFVNQGMLRAQRSLRTPPQEVSLDVVAASFVSLTVPADLLEVISISANNQNVAFMPRSQFLEVNDTSTGQPTCWTRKGTTILMKPLPADGLAINLYYYGQFTPFTSDAQVTSISLNSPDLIIYAALKYAADYYIDERADAWDATYHEIANDVQYLAYTTDGGGTIQPTALFDQD